MEYGHVTRNPSILKRIVSNEFFGYFIICILVHFIAMSTFSKLGKCVIRGIGFCGGAFLINYSITHFKRDRVFAFYEIANTSRPDHGQWDRNWDHRDSTDLNKSKKDISKSGDTNFGYKNRIGVSKAVRHIILIRHGQYNLNGKTDEERILTSLGRYQAELTGRRLVAENIPINTLIRSTMARAIETSEILAYQLPKNIKIIDDPLLIEGAPIPPEPPIGRWKPEATYTFQDGPRIEAAFRKYFHRAHPEQENDSYDVIVCHANVIRYFVCRALQFSADAWLRFSLIHASITQLSISPNGNVVLHRFGDAGHMPKRALTTS